MSVDSCEETKCSFSSGGRCRKAMLGVWESFVIASSVNTKKVWIFLDSVASASMSALVGIILLVFFVFVLLCGTSQSSAKFAAEK